MSFAHVATSAAASNNKQQNGDEQDHLPPGFALPDLVAFEVWSRVNANLRLTRLRQEGGSCSARKRGAMPGKNTGVEAVSFPNRLLAYWQCLLTKHLGQRNGTDISVTRIEDQLRTCLILTRARERLLRQRVSMGCGRLARVLVGHIVIQEGTQLSWRSHSG